MPGERAASAQRECLETWAIAPSPPPTPPRPPCGATAVGCSTRKRHNTAPTSVALVVDPKGSAGAAPGCSPAAPVCIFNLCCCPRVPRVQGGSRVPGGHLCRKAHTWPLATSVPPCGLGGLEGSAMLAPACLGGLEGSAMLAPACLEASRGHVWLYQDRTSRRTQTLKPSNPQNLKPQTWTTNIS